MFCASCGKEIKEGIRFCPYCGQQTAGANETVNSNGTVNPNIMGQAVVTEKPKSNKVLIGLGIGIIALLLLVILVLIGTGKKETVSDTNNINNTNDVSDVKSEETQASALVDIMGDWKLSTKIWGDNDYMNLCTRPSYIRVEAEGLKAMSSRDASDSETGERIEGKEVLFYMVDVSDVNVEEEDGVKYYYYTANMEFSVSGQTEHTDTENRLYFNSETGTLFNELKDSDTGYWQEISEYTSIDSIEDDKNEVYSKQWEVTDEDTDEETVEMGNEIVTEMYYVISSYASDYQTYTSMPDSNLVDLFLTDILGCTSDMEEYETYYQLAVSIEQDMDTALKQYEESGYTEIDDEVAEKIGTVFMNIVYNE